MKTWTKLSIAGIAAAAVGCSTNTVSLNTGGAGGAGSGTGGAAQTTATQTTATSSVTTASSTKASVGATTAAVTTGSSMLEQARITCMNKINALRATKGLTPYTRWTSAETCVDQEATKDEQTMMPHGAWLSMMYPCNGNGQNECLGQGIAGIDQCLQQMWDERLQPNCSGCDACAGSYNPNCPNCDFYGTMGPECGHYVNLSAKWHTMAACGFSSLGGWDAINFQ